MTPVEYDSSASITNPSTASYSSSFATTTSASSNSVWSDSASQSSGDTASTAFSSSDSDTSERLPTLNSAICATTARLPLSSEAVAPQLRQNPRRTSSASRGAYPPALVRQTDRKVNFVENLVDSSTLIVEAIWPTSSVVCRAEARNDTILPLRTFIQETLRRSRTSYSTLQVALYYLILIKPHIPEHDFTMEQPLDCAANRALLCGRRMFLAALILASKYLQDRNFSARAWSKISGLATQEINENEMAFLIAVDWNLHVTDAVYQRWTECVMKFPPPQPPSPGGVSQLHHERQCEDFRRVILQLNPGLETIHHDLSTPTTPASVRSIDLDVVSPRSLLAQVDKLRSPAESGMFEATSAPRSCNAPDVMEPALSTTHRSQHQASGVSLLPMPCLTPHSGGYSTPAVSAAGQLLRGGSAAMAMAMAQVTPTSSAHSSMCRWPAPVSTSPHRYLTRRSSLASSVSTASSPESMISDISRTSRSSSISSASSLAHAPSSKLDVQARCRYAKLSSDRLLPRTLITSVPEEGAEERMACSPQFYTGPVGDDNHGVFSSKGAFASRKVIDMNDSEAARVLQGLQYHREAPTSHPEQHSRPTMKRSRPLSMDKPLHDNVRQMLRQQAFTSATGGEVAQVPASSSIASPRHKRICYTTEAMDSVADFTMGPIAGGLTGPSMWNEILN